jgi:hypothetical protein
MPRTVELASERYHCHGCNFVTYIVPSRDGPACGRCGFINSRPHRIEWPSCTCLDCGEHVVLFNQSRTMRPAP